jgi:xanthine dehydrogenase YagS FAD-binding subunit
MNPFQYVTASTPDEAVSLAGQNGRYLAGGIDLLGEMKEISPSRSWPRIRNQSQFPGIIAGRREVGSPQIRNVATLAGNLLQHSRCWYYRQPDIVCLKRGGTTCYAAGRREQISSHFSAAAPASALVSNLAVALAALDATFLILRALMDKTSHDDG